MSFLAAVNVPASDLEGKSRRPETITAEKEYACHELLL